MSDQPTVQTPVDRLEERIKQASFAQLSHSSSTLPDLLNRATSLFDEYSFGDQAYATALMMGMLWAAFEGERVEFEALEGYLISVNDRIKLWAAVARVSYREGMAARNDPLNPERKGVM